MTKLEGNWQADAVHSRAGFKIKHFGLLPIHGEFNEFDVKLENGGDTLKLVGSATVESVEMKNEQLHGHLMSPDFFDNQLYPEIKFEASDLKVAEDGTVKADGTLTMKGTTGPIELTGRLHGPVEDPYNNQRVGLELYGRVNRHDYDISWNAPMPGGDNFLGDTVELSGEFELVQGE